MQYYTGRDLSFGSDRPVAISGIARALQRIGRKKIKYIAGMWSHGLLRWLLWETEVSAGMEVEGGYRAPSWSWLAVRGRVFYDSDLIQGLRYLKTNAHARVVRWGVVTDDGTGFGIMKAGYLQLRIVLIPVGIEKKGNKFEAGLKKEGIVGMELGEWILKGDLSWSWDVEINEAMVQRNVREGVGIFVMPVMEITPTKGSEDACLYGLVVERVDFRGHNDVYRRVGILTVFGSVRKAKADEVSDRERTVIRLI